MAGEKEHPQLNINIGRLPIETLPKELQVSGRTFQRLALGIKGLPAAIDQAYEQDLFPVLDTLPDASDQMKLAIWATTPTTREKIFNFYAMSAELDTSVRKMDNAIVDIINKSTKGGRPNSGKIQKFVTPALEITESAYSVNPLDSLSPQAPSLMEISQANIRPEDMFSDYQELARDAFFSKLRPLFQDTGDPEQISALVFLTSLATGGHEPINSTKRAELRQKKVSAETVLMLNNVGVVLDEYLGNYTYVLMQRAYGREDFYNPEIYDVPDKSELIQSIIGIYSLDSTLTSDLLPTSYSTLIDSGFIPSLEAPVAEYLKNTFSDNFYRKYPELLTREDQNGNRPYAILKERYTEERAMDWLNTLVPNYQSPPDARDNYEEFFWESKRIRSFIGDQIISIDGDENIASISFGLHGKNAWNLDIIITSHENEALAIQVSSGGPGALQISGIPGVYAKESMDLVGNIFSKVLTEVRNRGYLDHRITLSSDPGVEEMRKEYEEKYREKAQGLQTSLPEDNRMPIRTDFLQEPQLPSTETTVFEQKTRRFTITTDPEIIRKSGLSAIELQTFQEEIKNIEYSPHGTYPMRNLHGYNEDIRRISIRKIATTPNGGKVRVNLRALAEFEPDGKTGHIKEVSTRQGVYKNAKQMFK